MKNFLLIYFFNISCVFSQNKYLKYVGNIDEKMHFSYNFIEFNKDFSTLSLLNRTLEITSEEIVIVYSNDIRRNIQILSKPQDSLEFILDKSGEIKYWSENNPFRKTESEFVNFCYKNFGQIAPCSEKKLFSKINLSNGQSGYYDKDHKKEIDLLNSFNIKGKLSVEFYKYFSSLYWSLTLYNNLELKTQDKEIAHQIEDSFVNVDYLINIFEYRKLLVLYNVIQQKKFKVQSLSDKLDLIINNFSNSRIRDYLLYYEIRNNLDINKNFVLSTEIFDKFQNNCENKYFLKDITADYQRGHDDYLLSEILSKHKGKLILVDFWASWCIPCREEFAFELPLILKFPNVDFVFVSIDTRKSSWQNAMAQYPKLLNNQNSYLLKKSTQNQILKKINLSSIPRYVLFDKTGEIIDDNAPRPSTKELQILLQKHF